MTAHAYYERMSAQRDPYLKRARQAAALTIPSLLPLEGSSGATTFATPFQSVGARGVNNLGAKILLALFPPGGSFFRLDVDEFVLDELAAKSGSPDALAELQSALSKMERSILSRMEQGNARPTLAEAIKHLIVAGNALLANGDEANIKFHPLTNYVVKRDLEGEPLQIVVRESLSRMALPPEVRAIVEAEPAVAPQYKDKAADSAENTILLYTMVTRQDNGSWRVFQEVCQKVVPGSVGTYPKGKCAFLPLRWVAVSREDYGRGHVEEYLGDMNSLESISQSVVEFAAACSKILFFVDEGGVTQKKVIQDAPSGALIDGQAKDVTILQMEKYADFKVAYETMVGIEKRMEQAFLLNSSIQRNAERVTAEEVRFMAGELEQALGGVYSTLSKELQFPLVVRVMAQLQKERKLPSLPSKVVVPKIITGLEGLGRTSDLNKLDMLVKGMAETFGQDAIAQWFNVGDYASRRATALGIEIKGLVRTTEEVQQTAAQQQQQAMTQKLGPAAIPALSKQVMQAREQAQGASPGTAAPAGS